MQVIMHEVELRRAITREKLEEFEHMQDLHLEDVMMQQIESTNTFLANTNWSQNPLLADEGSPRLDLTDRHESEAIRFYDPKGIEINLDAIMSPKELEGGDGEHAAE